MKVKARPGLALAAIYPAVAVPILLPLLREMHAPDAVTGLVMGVLLGLAMLLLALATRSGCRTDS